MKKWTTRILSAFTIIAFCAALLFAQSENYRFRPKAVAVGTVYHYLKTNIDGSHPENVSLYIADKDKIESFKYQEKGTRAGLVKAEMDWTSFQASRIESWQVTGKSDQKLFATLIFNKERRAVEVSIPAMKAEKEFAPIDVLPFHLYNFDLASLNVTFPHLIDPKRRTKVGIADPTFRSDGPMFAYRGELDVVYIKDEIRNGRKCRRYSATGAGIGGRGAIWVNKAGGYIEDMEFDVADNPDWTTFKLKLIKTEKMTPAEWQQFIASRF